MPEHFHAFQWIGYASALDKSSGVRTPPPPPTSPEEFRNSPLPPFRMCDWLLKPQSHIKATGDLEAALSWLSDQWRQLEPNFALPHQERLMGGRLQYARDALTHCGSMAWGHWLKGERYGHTSVVGCPDFHAPHYPCPASAGAVVSRPQ